MAISETEVVVIGGGAAGIAAARRLRDGGVPCLIVEARSRLGGRAWTAQAGGFALDMGCGWLHSAERNPWAGIAERQGRAIDKTKPPWERPSREDRFPLAEQREFVAAQHALDKRIETFADGEPDRPASAFLEPDCRWNVMMNAISTYYSGVELERISARDLARYREDNDNWRVREGYGATVEACGAGLPTVFDYTVERIDHRGRNISIETNRGWLGAERVIVTLPTPMLAQPELFDPPLPDKTQAATGLPLGLADKLFLSLANAGEFEPDSRLYGATDSVRTASYHFRPFGRPLIEAYFGGGLAWDLEADGDKAFFRFAEAQLVDVFGSSFARRIKPLALHRWGADPFARGSYSYAVPGRADCRAALAQPVDGRIFFAGEACSLLDFSTANGAYETGVAAAEAAIAARGSC